MKYIISLLVIIFINCSCNQFQKDKYHYVSNKYKPKYKVGDTYCYRSPISNQSFELKIDSIKSAYDSEPLSGMFSGYDYYEYLSYYYSMNKIFYGRILISYYNIIDISLGKQGFSNSNYNYYTFYDSLNYFGNIYYNIYLMDGGLQDSLISILYNLNKGILGFNCQFDTFIICK